MNSRKIFVSILFVMIMLATATCQPAGPSSPAVTSRPTAELAAASVTPTPTATLSPTSTPAPTATATPTVTPTPIPTLPPEQVGGLSGVPDPRRSDPDLFDLTDPDAPISQFVNALKSAGIQGLTAEKVASDLTFEYRQYQRRDEDGNFVLDAQGKPVMDSYVFGVWELSPDSLPNKYKKLAGRIPILWAKQDGGNWRWIDDRTGINLVPPKIFADPMALKIGTMFDSNKETQRYLTLFNASLIPNTSWSLREPQRHKFQGIDFVKSLFEIAHRAGAEPILGGPLIYNPEYPDWVRSGAFADDELEQVVRDHIRDFMQKFPDVEIWNVINELQSNWNKNDPVANQLGSYRLLETAFEEARKTNPEAILVFSDGANYFFSTENLMAETEKDLQMIRFLKKKGLVDAIAVHGHFNMNKYQPAPSEEEFARVLQAYKDLGVQVYITELDVSVYNKTGKDRLLYQAEIYQDIITTYLQSGAGDVIIFWGVKDDTSWLETALGNKNADALLFADDGRVKIDYYIMLKALYELASQR